MVRLKADPTPTLRADPTPTLRADPTPALRADPTPALRADPPPVGRLRLKQLSIELQIGLSLNRGVECFASARLALFAEAQALRRGVKERPDRRGEGADVSARYDDAAAAMLEDVRHPAGRVCDDRCACGNRLEQRVRQVVFERWQQEEVCCAIGERDVRISGETPEGPDWNIALEIAISERGAD